MAPGRDGARAPGRRWGAGANRRHYQGGSLRYLRNLHKITRQSHKFLTIVVVNNHRALFPVRSALRHGRFGPNEILCLEQRDFDRRVSIEALGSLLEGEVRGGRLQRLWGRSRFPVGGLVAPLAACEQFRAYSVAPWAGTGRRREEVA